MNHFRRLPAHCLLVSGLMAWCAPVLAERLGFVTPTRITVRDTSDLSVEVSGKDYVLPPGYFVYSADDDPDTGRTALLGIRTPDLVCRVFDEDGVAMGPVHSCGSTNADLEFLHSDASGDAGWAILVDGATLLRFRPGQTAYTSEPIAPIPGLEDLGPATVRAFNNGSSGDLSSEGFGDLKIVRPGTYFDTSTLRVGSYVLAVLTPNAAGGRAMSNPVVVDAPQANVSHTDFSTITGLRYFMETTTSGSVSVLADDGTQSGVGPAPNASRAMFVDLPAPTAPPGTGTGDGGNGGGGGAISLSTIAALLGLAVWRRRSHLIVRKRPS